MIAMKKKIATMIAPLAAPALLLGLTGCSAEAPDAPDHLGAAAQAIGEAACGTDAANESFTGTFNYTYSSTYPINTGCAASTITDVTAYDPSDAGTGSSGVYAQYAGPNLTTSGACGATSIRVDLYTWTGSAWSTSFTTSTKSGLWFLGTCLVPLVGWTTDSGTLTIGDNYRFVAQSIGATGGLESLKIFTQNGS
jgi:hypothetical protein